MIKAAISGSSGVIGKQLMQRLNELDIKPIPIPRSFLYDYPALLAFFYKNPVEYIFHLAGYGNSYDHTDDFAIVGANIYCLFNLLMASKNMDYLGFINFSTSSVMLPYDTMYSATKAGGERIVKAFVNKHDKPVVSIRPFTLIGRGEQYNHLIPTLIRSCKTGEKMSLAPDPRHDFIGSQDFLDAIVLIMEHTKELKGKTIDIGTGKMTSNQEIREIVEKLTEKTANVDIVKNMRPYDALEWVAKPEVIQYLGWKQTQTIEDIIREMI
mgnify:CR=1 FL=1